jgi:hypothetical protein
MAAVPSHVSVAFMIGNAIGLAFRFGLRGGARVCVMLLGIATDSGDDLRGMSLVRYSVAAS